MSPIFVCTFADGEVTRMTTFQSGETLNLGRGVRLACAAYESRTKKAPPPIVEAHYERDGEVLESYEREQLAGPPGQMLKTRKMEVETVSALVDQ
jgi:hypothetical protein